MNCRKFETIINDLARASVIDAEARKSGLAHAENCARCASRLADERALTLGLRAMSACATTKEAPARLEATLLAAFRANAGASTQASQTTSVIVPMLHRTRHRSFWQAGAAIAAAILLAAMLSLVRLQPGPASTQPDATHIAQATRAAAPPVQTPSNIEAFDAPHEKGVSASPASAFNQETGRPRKLTPSYQSASLSKTVRHTGGAVNANAVNPNNAPRLINAGSNPGEREIATDFMPLTYDGGALAMESGHVVRVELPRSALVSMGLPMNLERAGEPIKADVLMGDDGVARAIRFVR